MKALTESEATQLESLLKRAIANSQFALHVASPERGAPDELTGALFGDGDRHDGNSVTSDSWMAQLQSGSGEEPVFDEDAEEPTSWREYTDRPEIHVYVDDRSICSLAGVSQTEAEQIVAMRG